MDDNTYLLFPTKRIKPFDGMEITADVWEQSHALHRQAMQSHSRFLHGAGIISGFEVVASDPADKIIYVLPGAAIDPNGQVIVLTEPVAYDLGAEVSGLLYLTISYREKDQNTALAVAEEAPRYIQHEFLLTARPHLNEPNAVELARFERSSKSSSIRNALDPDFPQNNEIDTRFRSTLSIQPTKQLSVATIYLGKVKQKTHGRGMVNLSHEMHRTMPFNLIVDDEVGFSPDALNYGFLYLVGEGEFSFDEKQTRALKNYLEGDGFILMESCDAIAEKSFQELCNLLKINLKQVGKQHSLLWEPYHFAEAPAGFESTGSLTANNNLVLSTFNYGRLWFGEKAKATPTREEIRAAMEWGQNLTAYAINLQE